jgi:hypothetical protein
MWPIKLLRSGHWPRLKFALIIFVFNMPKECLGMSSLSCINIKQISKQYERDRSTYSTVCCNVCK